MAGATTARIVLEDVRKTFRLGDGSEVVAVADMTFSAMDREILGIVGKSGGGKSTCMSLMLGLIPPSRGTVRVDGVDPHANFEGLRGRIGVIFQTDRLIPWRTALGNAEMGLEVLGVPRAERRERARHWLERVGLGGFENAFPHQLSGGMRQRVAIARAFTVNPDILFCDEAFGHLDVVTGAQLRATFMDLVQEEKKTCVFITHDIGEAIEVSHRILVFDKPARVLAERRTDVRGKQGREELMDEIVRAIESGNLVG